LVALAAAALLVAPVAGSAAKQDGVDGGKPEGVGGGKPEGVGGGKPDGVGGPTGSKKCEKPRSVGFKVNGTFGQYVAGILPAADLTVNVIHANRHARDWLGVPLPTPATFELDGTEMLKFIGLAGFEDAVATDVVKLKAKLALPKHGCPPEEDAVTELDEEGTEVSQESTELSEDGTQPDVTKVKVKRPNTETDEAETVETD
jgi:hypothetical protein